MRGRVSINIGKPRLAPDPMLGSAFREGDEESWSSYWAKHLFGESTLDMRIDSRSGLTLVDSTGSADATILPSYCSTVVGNTGITPAANTVLVARFARLGSADVIIGSHTAGAMFRFARASGNWQLSWGNQEYIQSSGGVDANWHTLIIYDKRAWVLASTIELTDASILYQIANTTPTCYNASATWGTATNTIHINKLNPYEVYGDSTISDLFIGTITDSVITWQRKYIIPQPVFVTGTNLSEYVFDTLSSPTHMTCQARVTNAVRGYSASASTYPLLNGYSLYRREGSADIHLPYKVDGTPNTPPSALATNGYVWISDHPANSMHNLACSKIRFAAGSIFNRSDTDVWEDEARTATDYDAVNPTDFDIKNLNRFILSDWLKSGYDGRIFAHVDDNSLLEEDRDNLVEIFTYPTGVTGDDFNKVLQFCGDYTGYVTELWLHDPYNEVYKITAVGDAEFKFNINNAFVYSIADIYTIVDGLQKFNADEDFCTTFLRFTASLGKGQTPAALIGEFVVNPINFINSYPWGVCSEVAQFARQVLRHYIDAMRFASKDDHTANMIPGVAFMDYRLSCLAYKDRYVLASLEEIKADNLIFTEPLRKTTPAIAWYDTYTYHANYHINDLVQNDTMLFDPATDNFKMAMPDGSSFVFPVKSTNIPKSYDAHDINYAAQGVLEAPTGVTGVIEMPFSLTQITGTGSVIVDGVTYTLPAEEADLKAVLQAFDDLYRTFTIITNTGGIEAEYFVNHRRALLYNKNTISRGIISGDIEVSRVKTDIPITTFNLSVNKGSAERWTILFEKYFTTNKTFKHPVTCTDDSTHDVPSVHFLGGDMNPQPIQFYSQTNVNKAIVAGTPVIDKCFASILTPKSITFASTLELTFTSVDGSLTYYTLDGSTPDATDTLYTEPFTISATTTVKWINIKEGYADSHVNTRVITKS